MEKAYAASYYAANRVGGMNNNNLVLATGRLVRRQPADGHVSKGVLSSSLCQLFAHGP